MAIMSARPDASMDQGAATTGNASTTVHSAGKGKGCRRGGHYVLILTYGAGPVERVHDR